MIIKNVVFRPVKLANNVHPDEIDSFRSKHFAKVNADADPPRKEYCLIAALALY